MQIEVKLPEDLEDGGNVLDVFVSVGDVIEVEQGLVEIETDKATVEVPSSHAGKVVEVKVQEGDELEAGGTILLLETSAEAPVPAPETAAPAPEKVVPEPTVEAPPAKAETPEAAPPPTAPADAPAAKPVEPVPVASVPAPPAPAPLANPPTATPTQPSAPATSTDTKKKLAPAGPAVRRFAREVGVDISSITGTGPGGRITREDVLAVVRQSSQAGAQQSTAETATAKATTSSPASTPAPSSGLAGDAHQDKWGPVRVEKMSKIRKTIASKMHESWSTAPRVTNFDDADVTSLEAMRQASKADYAKSGVKLTTMPFIIKACALSLKSNPLVNASIDMANEQIIYKDYVHIGIAVDTERGLVVPSLRNADQLSIPSIARALGAIADSARTGNFAIDDLRGSTFTISNLGAIGGTYSTPIINTPEVAILLVGRSRKLPVVMDDEMKIRLMMPLSLSYDHRLVDGGAAARFLNDVIGFLNTPSRLLMAP